MMWFAGVDREDEREAGSYLIRGDLAWSHCTSEEWTSASVPAEYPWKWETGAGSRPHW